MLSQQRMLVIGTFAFMLAIFPGSESNADLITNGNFESAGPNGPDTQHTGQAPNQNESSQSGAADWFIFHNVNGSTETNSLTYDEADLPTIFPTQDRFTDRLLRVEASHAGNGLVQTWAPLGQGPAKATGSIWIYTGPGQKAGVGIGNGGNTQTTKETSGIGGQWELLTFDESTSPVNEITVYATTSGSLFYVDMASVHSVPEPTSAGFLAASVLGFAARRRRRA